MVNNNAPDLDHMSAKYTKKYWSWLMVYLISVCWQWLELSLTNKPFAVRVQLQYDR